MPGEGFRTRSGERRILEREGIFAAFAGAEPLNCAAARSPQPALGHARSLRFRRDLVNKQNEGATQFCIFDAHERFHQIQAIGCREEIGQVGGRGSLGRPLRRLWDAGRCWRALEENGTGTCRIWERCCRRLALMRLEPFSYFWTCRNVSPRAFAMSVWLISSMSRRMRKWLPTCLSVG
jgi:hypothetical protein